MHNRYNYRKGSTLTIVLVVFSIAAILGFILIDATVQGLRGNKLQSDMDYSYYAGESAVERCFDNIQTVCTPESYTSAIDYDGTVSDFTDKFIEKINSDSNVKKSYTTAGSNAIDVGDDTANKADVTLKIEKAGETELVNARKVKISIGVRSDARYKNAGGQSVYAKKTFTVTLPDKFLLNAAVTSIGDLMVCSKNGGIDANIDGDVNVYGTSPEEKNMTEQYYYGGVYAKSKGNLKVNGYILTRSFIRAGEYSSNPDNSRIVVTKDAIAKGIQVFGKSDSIVVHRNAYTFDDVEMNGEDSVIAINGSFFGLSLGDRDFKYHDSSSAVVNSAPLHYGYSPDSMKSRIVINGDVFINGGTYKLDFSGEGEGQIEDASMLWSTATNKPYYKSYSGVWTDYCNSLNQEYIAAGDRSIYKGFLNLFQVWNPIRRADCASDTEYNDRIDSWLSEINTMRANNNVTGRTIPDTISGYCNYSMAANNRFYIKDNNEDINDVDHIVRERYLLSSYDIPEPISDKDGMDTYWSGIYNGAYEPWYNYNMNMSSRLENLKTSLTEKCQILVERGDMYGGDSHITHSIKAAPESVYGNNLFQYLVNKSLNAPDDPDDPAVITYDTHNTAEILEYVSVPDKAKAYLVVNKDPLVTLVVKEKFKGIIISAGKVIVGRGAYVDGAIVAAGRGYKATGSYVDSVSSATDNDHIPRVASNGANRANLDNGDYAGVLITDKYGLNNIGSATDSDPRISFPGRETLLDYFDNETLKDYLHTIF